jgi:hypothetical protein
MLAITYLKGNNPKITGDAARWAHVRSEVVRSFHLNRTEDESGISGVGIVAEGVVFADGGVMLYWLTQYRSVAFYKSVEDLEAIHGHHGRTAVIWRDNPSRASDEDEAR